MQQYTLHRNGAATKHAYAMKHRFAVNKHAHAIKQQWRWHRYDCSRALLFIAADSASTNCRRAVATCTVTATSTAPVATAAAAAAACITVCCCYCCYRMWYLAQYSDVVAFVKSTRDMCSAKNTLPKNQCTYTRIRSVAPAPETLSACTATRGKFHVNIAVHIM